MSVVACVNANSLRCAHVSWASKRCRLLAVCLMLAATGALAQQQSEHSSATHPASWHGDYPVVLLNRPPAGRCQSRTGHLHNRGSFERISRGPQTRVELSAEALARDPLDASYILGDRVVRLEQGFAEALLVTGSATRERVSIVSEPVYGDLDGDGDEDSAMILAQDSGGSGTFYFAVAARQQRGSYLGSHGVLLGDRIVLEEISLIHGLVLVRYLHRGEGEPMAVTPMVGKTLVLRMEPENLGVLAALTGREQLLVGKVSIGHEVRSFTPCGQETAHWIVGHSAALDEIVAGYRELAVNAEPYVPLFMVGAGRATAPPAEGFGADYADAVRVDHLFLLRSEDGCFE